MWKKVKLGSGKVQAKDFLRKDFDRRQHDNPSYSVRAYARDLGVSCGLVSEILRGKRRLTHQIAAKIEPKLRLSLKDRRLFLQSFVQRENSSFFTLPMTATKAVEITDDQFRVIADWYHFAILTLVRLDGFRFDYHRIGQRLGISAVEAELAVSRLMRLKLLTVRDGNIVPVDTVTTLNDVPSLALKQSHKQTLEQAITSIFEVPIKLREITSTTIATTPERIQEAKPIVREFLEALVGFLEEGQKTEVYNINFQMVPVTALAKGNGNVVSP